MKIKYAVAIATIALGLSATIYAAGQSSANGARKIIILKSQGVAIAEVKLLTGDSLQINSMKQNLDVKTGILTSKGGVTIQLGRTGDSPVTITADEADVVSAAAK